MKIIYLLIALLGTFSAGGQTTVVLQPSAETGKDAMVSSRHKDQNIGATTEFIAATWTFQGEWGTYRSLLQFDLSSIPAGAQILEAKLSLYHNDVSTSNGHSGSNATYLRRVTEPWDESTVTWNSQPSSTEIDHIYLPASIETDQDYEDIDITALIQNMHQDPIHNFGFVFMLEEETIYRSMKFATSDAEEESHRPKLSIIYTTEVTCNTFQPGSEGKDAVTWSIHPDLNIGASPEFIAATWTFNGSEGDYRSFIEFDLSPIPSNAQIVSAGLSLYYNNTSTSNGHEGVNSVLLKRILEPWDELTITWNNQPNTTSDNEVTLPASNSEAQHYEDYDVSNLIQDMVSNPALSHGFMMRLTNENIYRSMKFASGDFAEPGRHPKLDVCYTTSVANNEIPLREASIVPNPFAQSFMIHGLDGQFAISISDISGKIVYWKDTVANNNGIIVDELYHLPAGLYLIRASGEFANYYAKVFKTN